MKSQFKLIVCSACLIFALVLPTSAAVIEVGSPLGTVFLDSESFGEVSLNEDGSFQWTGSWSNESYGLGLDWNLAIDPDPSISGVAAFTNLMGVTMNFTYNVSALSTVAIPLPIVNGTSTLSVLDTDNNGATMAALAGDAIYDAFIQASSQQTLFVDPYSLVAPAQGGNIDLASWGPQAATVSLAIGDTFGINHDFSLTAGDQATLNSNFFIVPEPATGLLLLTGVVTLIRRRR